MLTKENIIDGFYRMERHDVRVGRVDIPVAVFWGSLVKDPAWRDCVDMHWVNPAAHADDTPKPRRVGNLWGAGLYLGGKDVVVKPERWDEGVRWQHGPRDTVVRPLIISESGINEQWVIGNLYIFVKSHCKPVGRVNGPEQAALETLRESLTEDQFRRYIKTGFLSVTGRSGRTYQIPRGSGISPHVIVWERGKKIAEICSYILDRKMPPTDRVIAFKTIIEADEQEMWRRGNVFNMQTQAA